MDLRAFIYGIMVGIAIIIGSITATSVVLGVRWEIVPVAAAPR